MAVYRAAYRSYDARAPLRRLRFAPIARETLRPLLVRRSLLALIGVAWLPCIVRAVQIVVVSQFPQAARVLPIDARLFEHFLDQQIGLATLVALFGGAGLIANDRRSGGLLVYLSRPLTRLDYVLGKLTPLLALIGSVTLVPASGLLLLAVAVAPEQWPLSRLTGTAAAVAAQSAVIAVVLSLMMLAFSALCRSARAAGLTVFALLASLEVLQGILRHALRTPAAALLSIRADLRLVGATLFSAPDGPVPSWQGALVLLGVILACVSVIRARVRAVEIVQ